MAAGARLWSHPNYSRSAHTQHIVTLIFINNRRKQTSNLKLERDIIIFGSEPRIFFFL